MAPQLLEVKVADDLGDAGVLLSRSWAPSFQDAASDAGMGKLSIQANDPDIGLVDIGKFLYWLVDGVHVYTSRVEQRHRVRVDAAEESGQLRAWSGRGLVTEWEDADVRPENGFGKKPYSTARIFGFANPYFDDSSWTAAYQQFQQYLNLGPPANLYGLPEDWPDPFDYWIWSQPYTGDEVDPALSYFRKTYTMAGGGTFRIVCAGDNKFKAYIDGIEILSYLTNANEGWMRLYDIDVDMTAGEHVFAMAVENIVGPVNFAALIAGIWFNGGADGLGDKIITSDDSWVMVHNPDSPPGFSVDQVLQILLDEAQSDDLLLGWSIVVHGSFPIVPEISVQVGLDYFAVLRQFAESMLEYDTAATARELHIWPKNERGAPSGVTFAIGQNVTQLTDDQKSNPKNVVHVLYDDGHLEVEDTATRGGFTSIDLYGRRREYLSLKNVPSEAAARFALVEWFDLYAWPLYSVTVGLEPDAEVPYADFDKGDSITVDGEELIVHSFSGSVDDNGFVKWAVEVGTRQQLQQETFDRWLRSLALGSGNGKTLQASPNSPGVTGASLHRFPSEQRIAAFSFVGKITDAPPLNRSGNPALDRPFRLTGMILGSHGDGTSDTAVEFDLNGATLFGATLGPTDTVVRANYVADLVAGDVLEAVCTVAGGHTGVVATPRGYYL